MERHLHVAIPDNTLLGEFLERYEEDVSPLHKSHQVKKYRLRTFQRHLGATSEILVVPVRR